MNATSEILHDKLLRPDDRAAVSVRNRQSQARFAIVCDPWWQRGADGIARIGGSTRRCWRGISPGNIGAADVADRLAVRMNAPAVLAGFSRLVIDLNRPLDDLTSIRGNQ